MCGDLLWTNEHGTSDWGVVGTIIFCDPILWPSEFRLTLQTHILMSTLSETRFFVLILIFRKNAECQTKAGNQECLNVLNNFCFHV